MPECRNPPAVGMQIYMRLRPKSEIHVLRSPDKKTRPDETYVLTYLAALDRQVTGKACE